MNCGSPLYLISQLELEDTISEDRTVMSTLDDCWAAIDAMSAFIWNARIEQALVAKKSALRASPTSRMSLPSSALAFM